MRKWHYQEQKPPLLIRRLLRALATAKVGEQDLEYEIQNSRVVWICIYISNVVFYFFRENDEQLSWSRCLF